MTRKISIVLIVALFCFLLPLPVRASGIVISNVQASVVTADAAVITWSSDVLATGNVEYGTTTGYGLTAPSPADTTADNASHAVVLSGLVPATTYHYRVKSSDASGNEVVSGDYTFTTRAFMPSGVAASYVTTTTATLTWATDVLATGNVEYGTTISYGSIAPTPPDTTADNTSHVITLRGLSPETTYHYRVKSKDALDREEVTGDFVFTTLKDITAPTISAVISLVTTTTAVITWNTNEPATSQVEYGTTIFYGSTTVFDPTLVTSHIAAWSGLTPGTLYHYRVKPKDTYNNEAVSGDLTFVTVADVTAPTISEVTALATTTTTALVIWTTDEPATSQVEYGLTTDYGSTTAFDPSLVTGHLVALSGIAPGTTYHYRVRSKDASDNEAVSADFTFTTVADVTAPVISAVAALANTATAATIAWVTDEPTTSQVEYGLTTAYTSATILDPTLATSHIVSLSGLAPGTTYHFRAKSRDITGNETVTGDYSFTTFTPEVNEQTLVIVVLSDETPTVIDASATAGVKVSFSGTGVVSGIVRIIRYTAEPTAPAISFSAKEAAGGTGKKGVKFVDVQVSGFTTGSATITVDYTDAEVGGLKEESLRLYYWDGSSWRLAANSSVDTAANSVSGNVPVSALSGTPIAVGGSPPPINWVLIAIIAGAVLGVGVLGALVYLLLKRRRPTTGETL